MKNLIAVLVFLFCSAASAQAAGTALGIESYQDIASLQAELDKRLPRGTPLPEAEKLFAQEGAFRSDNLVSALGMKNGLQRGSSSEENFVFFFKPLLPAGKEGWEEAKDGWVIKATFFGGGFAIGKMKKPELARGALLSVTVLATPGKDASNKPGEAVGLVKKLLVYRREGQPIETFDEAEWKKIAAEHKSFPCKDSLTTDCLLKEALPLMGMPDQPARDSYLLTLSEIALQSGDQKTAKMLLKKWPSESELAAMEKEATDPARRTPGSTSFHQYRQNYTKLLFLSGDYGAAEKHIASLQEKAKTGEDYGAIITLVTAGKLDEALKVAKQTLEWKRETRDRWEGTSAHVHCENYTDSRAEGMAKLAHAFASAGQLDKAYETTRLLLTYWENKGYGQSSFCPVKSAERGFVKTMTQLMRAYAAKDNKEKAAELSRELQNTLMKQTAKITYSSKWIFEDTAKAAAETGTASTLGALAEFVATHSEMRYPSVYGSSNNDPVPLIYALAGQRDKADELLAQDGRVDPGRPPLGLSDASEETVRLATYFQTIRALSEAKDSEGALWFLARAAPFLEEHKKNISDDSDIFIYINLGRIFADLGKTEQSRGLLDDALALLKKQVETAGDNPRFNSHLFGHTATLYLRHAKLDEVLKWIAEQPVHFNGFVHARMAAQLAKEGRWDEFDALMPQAMAYAYNYKQPSENMSELANGLLDQGDVARYSRFVQLLSTPPEKMPQTAWTGTIIRSRPATVESTHYLWAITLPFLRVIGEKKTPEDLLADFWPHYIDHCQSFGGQQLYAASRDGNRKSDAKETMAGCYLWLLRRAAYQRQRDGLWNQ